jgi:hypothetical protein
MLSELLVTLLNRMPRKDMIRFVADLLLPADAIQSWNNVAASAVGLKWHTEVSVGRKRADLVLKMGMTPLLVIENKINAPLRVHQRNKVSSALTADREVKGEEGKSAVKVPSKEKSLQEEDSNQEDAEIRSQLHTYGEWLRDSLAQSQMANGWLGALVLLTHSSLAPDDFGSVSGPGNYGVQWQRTCRWHQVARWLDRVNDNFDGLSKTHGSGDQRPGWVVLAHEAAEFLRGRKMTNDNLSRTDLLVVDAYFSGLIERIEATFSTVREKIESEVPQIKFKKPGAHFDEDFRAVWGWGYLKAPYLPKKTSCYLAWGICYPTRDSVWSKLEHPLSEWPHALVALVFDAGDIPEWTPEIQSNLPNSWEKLQNSDSAYVCSTRPLSEFPGETDSMFSALADWAAIQVREVEPFLLALGKS